MTGLDQEPEPVLNDNCVRFWCPELTQEGQWHHLVLIFHRAGIMKNSSVSLYVDAELVNTQKVIFSLSYKLLVMETSRSVAKLMISLLIDTFVAEIYSFIDRLRF